MSKILIDRATVEQALEALNVYASKAEHRRTHADDCAAEEAITSLRAALAEPVQEPDVPETNFGDMVPVGWLENPFGSFRRNWLWKLDQPPQTLAWSIPLYAAQPQRPAEPVQDHFRDARKMVQDPAQKTEMRRCPRCWEPMFPPQPTPLTVERLRDALVAARIVPPAAVEDPDEYDDGVTLHRIEALHRRLA